jgi:hypothetical protein
MMTGHGTMMSSTAGIGPAPVDVVELSTHEVLQ